MSDRARIATPVVVTMTDECQELAASGWLSAEASALVADVLRMGRAGVVVLTATSRPAVRRIGKGTPHARRRALDRVRETAGAYPASGHGLCLAVREARRARAQRVTVIRAAMRGGEDAFAAAGHALNGPCPHEGGVMTLPAARRIGCMYCGNTGTANGAPCPVCRGGA